MRKPIRRWRRLAARSWGERALLLEAALWLMTAALLVRCVPFRLWSRFLGRAGNAPTSPDGTASQIARVQWAVVTARRSLPWNSTCLMDAAAGKFLLNRRQIGSTLYLGIQKAPAADGFRMDAHAWLRCGSLILTGESGHQRFTVVGTFTTEPKGE